MFSSGRGKRKSADRVLGSVSLVPIEEVLFNNGLEKVAKKKKR